MWKLMGSCIIAGSLGSRITNDFCAVYPWNQAWQPLAWDRRKLTNLFTRGLYGHRVLSLPASVCPSVCQLLACPRDNSRPKLGSPNLNHRCKRPWLRSLLFCGVIDLYFQGQIYLRSQNLPHFELVRRITHLPFKIGPPNLDQMFKIPWLRSLLFWGVIELVKSNLFSKSYLFASLLRLWNICETCKKRMKTESVPHPTWLRT